MSDLDAELEQAQADGRITVHDADAIRDFAAFLADSTSRCAVCLSDDSEGGTWKKHYRTGERIFICRECRPSDEGSESDV